MRSPRIFAMLTILVCITLTACGSKKSPTGGPLDTDKPRILGSSPAEFGDIGSGVIEISFSKDMDRTSLANSVFIYPPVMKKKMTIDGPTLKITIQEKLQDNTNYYVTLSSRLKDLRGNALDMNQTLVFRHGTLNNSKISGSISCEQPGDEGMPLELSLFTMDSLLVLSDRISGSTYSIETLNPQPYKLKAFIDRNLNGKYDLGLDPFFEGSTTAKSAATLDMFLAYADSSKPRIRRVTSISNRELVVTLSEQIKSYKSIDIYSDYNIAIIHSLLDMDKLNVLCAPLDSIEYTIQLKGVEDMKGNVSELVESKFVSKGRKDSQAPTVSYSNPRNGATVSSLQPTIEVYFSELIPPENIHAKLTDGRSEIPLKRMPGFGRMYRFQPTKELKNYTSHVFSVLSTTSDISGNKMKRDYELQFLPIKRTR